jgi:hypothetical protein
MLFGRGVDVGLTGEVTLVEALSEGFRERAEKLRGVADGAAYEEGAHSLFETLVQTIVPARMG